MTFNYKRTVRLENYLEIIFRMENKQMAARVKDIAEKLKLKKGSVSGALKSLAGKGFVEYSPYQPIHLTDEGRCLAEAIVKRNLVLSRFLVEVLQIEPDDSEIVARRMGPAVTEGIVGRMTEFMAVLNAYASASNMSSRFLDENKKIAQSVAAVKLLHDFNKSGPLQDYR